MKPYEFIHTHMRIYICMYIKYTHVLIKTVFLVPLIPILYRVHHASTSATRWGARAAYIVRSSSRFIDCHRRVSIINHLHCNRTAPRSDTEAPGRFSASAYNSRTAKSFQSTTPRRQWKCVVLQSAAIYPIRQTVFARRNPSARDTRDYTEADCVASYASTNGEICSTNAAIGRTSLILIICIYVPISRATLR